MLFDRGTWSREMIGLRLERQRGSLLPGGLSSHGIGATFSGRAMAASLTRSAPRPVCGTDRREGGRARRPGERRDEIDASPLLSRRLHGVEYLDNVGGVRPRGAVRASLCDR